MCGNETSISLLISEVALYVYSLGFRVPLNPSRLDGVKNTCLGPQAEKHHEQSSDWEVHLNSKP